ncbi:MAG: hypothetical protein AAGL66_02205 [Pseudomonadota bacterium]
MGTDRREVVLWRLLALVVSYWLLLQLSFARGFGVSAEALIIPALAAFGLVLPARPFRVLLGLLVLWVLALLLYRAADFGLQLFFARPLELKYDLYLFPTRCDLLWDSSSTVMAIAVLLLLGGLLGGAGLVLARLLGTAARTLQPVSALIAWCGFGVLLFSVASPPAQSLRIADGIHDAYLIADGDDRLESQVIAALRKEFLLPTDLSRLAGGDFLMFFIESYGRVLWDDPKFRDDLLPVFAQRSRELEQSGYRIASIFAESTTFGGASWVAHMSVMTGVECRNSVAWERLLHSSVRPLPSYFRAQGYETVSVMPAMDIDHWPDGEFFQFNRHLWFKDLGYDGPKYAWSQMPDQFALLQFDKQVLSATSEPVFAEVALTSSHAPFSERPLFHAGAWTEAALNATLAGKTPRRTRAIWAIDPDNYPRAIDYSVRSVTHFLKHHYRREGVAVIMGDHQPPRTVHRAEQLDEVRRFHVPLHIITANSAVHEALLKRGFSDGWFPDENAETIPMHGLRGLFLETLSGAPSPGIVSR